MNEECTLSEIDTVKGLTLEVISVEMDYEIRSNLIRIVLLGN